MEALISKRVGPWTRRMQSVRNSAAQARWDEGRAIDQVRISFHLGAEGMGKRAEEGNGTETDGTIS